MRMFTARVVDGRLELPDDGLPDGSVVTILVADGDEAGFTLTGAQREELAESIRQADRGQTIDGWKLLEDLES